MAKGLMAKGLMAKGLAAKGTGITRLDPRERIAPRSAALQRRMQLALGTLRGVTLGWAAVVCGIDTYSGVLDRPEVATIVLVILAAWSTLWTVAVGRRDRWVGGPAGVLVDLSLACIAVTADSVVYSGIHPQSFASAWPLLAVIATGIAVGPGVGLVGGLGVGIVGGAATAASIGIEGDWLSTLGTTVLLGASGWVSGWVAEQLRTTAQEAADAQARAEVARTLHDGVLQTLAVIQRRSDDDDLVALAREQDAALRAFLHTDRTDMADRARDTSEVGRGADSDAEPFDRLRTEIARIERTHAVAVQLVVIDVGTACGSATSALVGAVCEAVVNAAKHSGTDRVWVSVDRRSPSGTMVVVHDEGQGFDPTTTSEGSGITSSIRERVVAVGGGATVASAPGRGTDVTVWVP